ncbi:MAG: biopolymer transporter ExbD [Candidatus Zixiibacteriota bacterium]
MPKKRRVGIRIDMTPMVDIVILLLIFYMTTTQFKPPEAKAVELPSSHSMIELPDKNIINITVTKYDSIYVDWIERRTINIEGKDVTSNVRVVKTVDVPLVAQTVLKARADHLRRGTNALLVVKADRRARFGVMQKVMKAMQRNNLERFLIITEQETEQGAVAVEG